MSVKQWSDIELGRFILRNRGKRTVRQFFMDCGGSSNPEDGQLVRWCQAYLDAKKEESEAVKGGAR